MSEQQTTETFAGWAHLAIMGHVEHLGYVSECEMFGAKFLKVEPIDRWTGEAEPTIFYRPESVYSLTPRAEEEMRADIERIRTAAQRRQKLLSPPATEVEEDEDGEDDPPPDVDEEEEEEEEEEGRLF